MRFILRCLMLFVAGSQVAFAAPRVSEPWIRLVPGQTNAAGYLTLTSPKDDALMHIVSDCCSKVELHEMRIDDDIMRMRAVDSVALKGGEPLRFAPLGYHLMFIGLRDESVREGSTISATLHYQSGAESRVVFPVKLVGAHTEHH